MSPTILTADWSEYTSGPWWAVDNVWGNAGLLNGVDYTQTITINDSTFPDDTVLSWSWPSAYHYYGFPEIIYGSTPYQTNPDVQSTQLANFANLSTSYSITLSGSTNNYDVIFDMWFMSLQNGYSKENGGPNTIEYELCVVPYAPPNWAGASASNLVYRLTDSTLTNAGVYETPGYTDGADSWTNITVMLPGNMLSGTLSISDIIKSLIWNGVITGQE